MAHTWQPEEIVTAEKMNNIEQSIVNLNGTNDTLSNRINVNKESIDSINEKIGENNGTMGTINERIKTNADNIEINVNEIEAINNEITSIDGEINSIQQNYVLSDTALQTQIETLNNKGVTGYKGQYNAETSYKLGDIVSDNSKFYIYVNSNESAGQALDDNTTYWQETNTAIIGPAIEVGNSAPTNENVKLWIKVDETQEYEVPTVDEFFVEGHTLNIVVTGG